MTEVQKPNGLCPTLVVSGNFSNVIAAGPLSQQPGSMPYRTVLVQYETGDFSVHSEFFPELPTPNSILLSAANGKSLNSSLSTGDYFKPHQLVEATKAFAERVARKADELLSLYR